MRYFNKVICILIAVSFSMVQASPANSIPAPKVPVQQIDSSSHQSMPVLKTDEKKSNQSLNAGEKVVIGVLAGAAAVGIGIFLVAAYEMRNFGKGMGPLLPSEM